MTGEHHNALPNAFEIKGYRIVSVIGAGGFGITYLADEIATGRQVAIKEFMPAGTAMREQDGITVHPVSGGEKEQFEWGLDRFRQEASTLGGFRHRNIVRVHSYFEANGTAYLVMQYEGGFSLESRLRRDGRIEEAELIPFVHALLDGLSEVHRRGFLHRDIKPGNIYVRDDGSPVLLDFGAARYALGEKSRTLTSIITPGYAPPEQYEGASQQGPWTDIYGLGAVVYRCVTGEKPAEAPQRVNALARGDDDPLKTVVEAVGRHSCSSQLAVFIDNALAIVEANRPQTIEAWRKDLPVVEEPEPVLAVPGGELEGAEALGAGLGGSSEPERRRVWQRGWPGWAFAGLVLCLVGAAALAGSLHFGPGPQVQIRGLTAELGNERARREAVERQRKDLQSSLAGERTRREALERQRKELQSSLVGERTRREALERQRKTLQSSLTEWRNRNASLAKEKDALAAKLSKEQADRKKWAAEKHELSTELAAERALRQKMEKEGRTLQAKLDARAKATVPKRTVTPEPPTGNAAALYRSGVAAVKQRDFQRAFSNFLAAARQGYGPAQYGLGLLYYYGTGTPKNYRAALAWARRAANQNSASAMALLGLMYMTGKGTQRNYATAAYWSRRAAAAGSSKGMSQLGLAYEKGLGVNSNLYTAIRWYRRAAAMGDKFARGRLTSLGVN